MSGLTAISQPPFPFLQSEPKISCHSSPSVTVFPCASSSSSFKPVRTRYFGSNASPRSNLLRCSSAGRGGSESGDKDSRAVIDAFFLGKALAETLTERIESTIGEVLSGIGRLQAEQQKQILDFQEEVIERANRAKDKAARDAVEVQGPISPSIISPAYTVSSSPTTNYEAGTKQQPSKPHKDSDTAAGQDPALGLASDED